MFVIYINCSLFPFITWIISGLKRFETRNRKTLKAFIGKTVYLAETGKYKRPVIRCTCTISEQITVTDKRTYNAMRKYTKIIKGSCFDWNSTTKQKILYRLDNVKACNPFPLPDNAIRKGRIYAIIQV